MPNYFHADDVGPSFVRTMMAVSKKPKQFFEHMSVEGNIRDSIILMALFMIFPAIEPVYFSNMHTMLFVFPAVIVAGVFLPGCGLSTLTGHCVCFCV